jgi:hypothetical protein
VILEGASLSSQLLRIGVLLVWGVGTFAVAMRAFRWT